MAVALGVLFLLGGSLFIAGAVLVGRQAGRIRGRAPGVVVDLVLRDKTRGRSSAQSVWYPVVSWRTPTGTVEQFEGRSGANPARHRVGQQVTVAFDETGKHEPSVEGDAAVLAWIIAGLGSALVVAGGATLLVVGLAR